ncbi:tRNA pseudouridine(55) synthase TruB [Candidatus Peregrinibacteria bacterium HGW-Peregrinibacteria-1]|jgi:tRNA pseudouridine55 synthase|nr:MAG: tRNA pseudouridine(55) synthase TruB [Candidatus Peregrinibacteria bacterium HGW-Peregrinibacteria-1]
MKSGFILVDKPSGMTSFDVVKRVRAVLGVKKVGHAGTLDPLASGLMLIAFGEGTKLLEYFIGADKVYEVLAVFGATSTTFDADGEIVSTGVSNKIEQEEINKIIQERFLGLIDQVPPKYSALKIAGKRAYELARSGVDFDIKSREVRVYGVEVAEYDWPEVRMRVSCGSGTYIRSLVHDLGSELMGVGAYVKELRRLKVADFDLDDAVSLDEAVDSLGHVTEVSSLEEFVVGLYSVELDSVDIQGLADGKVLMGKKIDYEWAMAFHEGRLVGVVEPFMEGIKFKKVINVS